jgi:hypothetical protein
VHASQPGSDDHLLVAGMVLGITSEAMSIMGEPPALHGMHPRVSTALLVALFACMPA